MQRIAEYINARMASFENDMRIADKNHCAYMHSYARGADDALSEVLAFITELQMNGDSEKNMEDNEYEC